MNSERLKLADQMQSAAARMMFWYSLTQPQQMIKWLVNRFSSHSILFQFVLRCSADSVLPLQPRPFEVTDDAVGAPLPAVDTVSGGLEELSQTPPLPHPRQKSGDWKASLVSAHVSGLYSEFSPRYFWPWLGTTCSKKRRRRHVATVLCHDQPSEKRAILK